jgi:CheY-like chemotaxis protein
MTEYSTEFISTLLEGEIFNLMVVDDDEINRIIIQEFLKVWQLNSIFVASAEEAIEQIAQAPNKFDLLLMDIHLPNMSGIAATQLLRTKYALDIPVIALTADAMKDTKANMMKAGINDVILKPIKLPVFHQIVGNYIQQRLTKRKVNTN